MRTNKELVFIHNSTTGHFRLDQGQPLRAMETKVIVPEGSAVTHQTAMGCDENYHFITRTDLGGGMYRHDLTYHGINVPKEFINKN